MFELADYLVGIFKVEDCTQSLTIQNTDKLRILGIGEKEGEKENLTDNTFDNLKSPEKQSGINGDVSMTEKSQINGDISTNDEEVATADSTVITP